MMIFEKVELGPRVVYTGDEGFVARLKFSLVRSESERANGEQNSASRSSVHEGYCGYVAKYVMS